MKYKAELTFETGCNENYLTYEQQFDLRFWVKGAMEATPKIAPFGFSVSKLCTEITVGIMEEDREY